MGHKKHELRTIFLCIISALVSLLFVVIVTALWPFIWDIVKKSDDVFVVLNALIAWLAALQLLLGILIGIVAIPFVMFIVAPVLGFEIVFEKKIGLTNAVIVNEQPKNSVFSIFLYSYILFGPVVIITRILSTIGEQEMLQYYFIVGDYMKKSMPIILIFLVSSYILRDFSRVRSIRKNLIIYYPSRLQQFILVIIVGMGSIAALAPMYSEIVAIVGNKSLALKFFIYSILLGIIPSITMVIGFLIGIMVVGKPFFMKAVDIFEKIVKKYGKVEMISLTKITEESPQIVSVDMGLRG